MGKNDEHSGDTKPASAFVAVASLIGLTICFVAAGYYQADVPLVLYAIFGGGVLGTDNLLKLIKSIFRVNGNGK